MRENMRHGKRNTAKTIKRNLISVVSQLTLCQLKFQDKLQFDNVYICLCFYLFKQLLKTLYLLFLAFQESHPRRQTVVFQLTNIEKNKPIEITFI